jgi:LysM repeat protein
MLKRGLLYLLVIVGLSVNVGAQNANQRYTDYIDRWKDVAISEQEQHGIPASITLAQGLLESGAGSSRLATEGNNHFGIKCHKDWQGETMLRDDDAPNECFRVYESAHESFADHSRFLLRKRYESLFLLPVDDYKGWAHGLKQCGYATDPNYANRLISIIERYSLYNYDTPQGRNVSEDALFIFEHLRNSHPICKYRSLHYVIASPGDTYSDIAKEFGMKTKDLLRFNDVDADHEIRAWQEVYLQEKHDKAPADYHSIVIGEGESIHSIAQRMGMKLQCLKDLNPDSSDSQGTRLRLR